jgi:hypothetical protein
MYFPILVGGGTRTTAGSEMILKGALYFEEKLIILNQKAVINLLR